MAAGSGLRLARRVLTLLFFVCEHERLDQGLAFGLGNLVWADGQAAAAAGR